MTRTLKTTRTVNFDLEPHNIVFTDEEKQLIFEFGLREIDRRMLDGKTSGDLKMTFFRHGTGIYDLYGTWSAKEVFI